MIHVQSIRFQAEDNCAIPIKCVAYTLELLETFTGDRTPVYIKSDDVVTDFPLNKLLAFVEVYLSLFDRHEYKNQKHTFLQAEIRQLLTNAYSDPSICPFVYEAFASESSVRFVPEIYLVKYDAQDIPGMLLSPNAYVRRFGQDLREHYNRVTKQDLDENKLHLLQPA